MLDDPLCHSLRYFNDTVVSAVSIISDKIHVQLLLSTISRMHPEYIGPIWNISDPHACTTSVRRRHLPFLMNSIQRHFLGIRKFLPLFWGLVAYYWVLLTFSIRWQTKVTVKMERKMFWKIFKKINGKRENYLRPCTFRCNSFLNNATTFGYWICVLNSRVFESYWKRQKYKLFLFSLKTREFKSLYDIFSHVFQKM